MVLALKPAKETEDNLHWLGQPTVAYFPETREPIVGFFSLTFSEFVASTILVFVWKSAMMDKYTPAGTYGFVVGSLYGVVAMAMGKITGGSMNPARVFGPGLIGGDFKYIAFYLLAPLAGGLLGMWWYNSSKEDESKTALDANNCGLDVLKPVDIDLSVSEMSKLN